MTATCFGSIKGLVLRVTRLDDTGNPVIGPTGSAISAGFVSLAFAANIEAGEEFIVKGANGALCVNEKDCDQLKGYDLTVNLCQVDPEMYEIIGGVRPIPDYTTTNHVGYATGESLRCSGGFALETWSRQSGTGGLIYWLFPWITNGIVGGDVTIENGPVTFVVNGRTKANPNWGVGPYDVVGQAPDGTLAGPLLDGGILDDEHYLMTATTVAPPVEACGYVAVAA